MKDIPIVLMPRGHSAIASPSKYMTGGEISALLGVSKKNNRITEFLSKEAGLAPDAVHKYGHNYHPVWLRSKIEAYDAKRKQEANEALAKLARKPVDATPVADLQPAQEPEKVLSARDIIERLNKMSTLIHAVAEAKPGSVDMQPVLRAISDNEVRMREHIQKQVNPLVELLAELDGRVTALTKECGALVAFLNSQKK